MSILIVNFNHLDHLVVSTTAGRSRCSNRPEPRSITCMPLPGAQNRALANDAVATGDRPTLVSRVIVPGPVARLAYLDRSATYGVLACWRGPRRGHRSQTSNLLSPSTPASALPCPAGRSVPGRGGPERRRRPRPDGTGTPMLTVCSRDLM
jgi:hypothetical protein